MCTNAWSKGGSGEKFSLRGFLLDLLRGKHQGVKKALFSHLADPSQQVYLRKPYCPTCDHRTTYDKKAWFVKGLKIKLDGLREGIIKGSKRPFFPTTLTPCNKSKDLFLPFEIFLITSL
jgi:hypothetical protein